MTAIIKNDKALDYLILRPGYLLCRSDLRLRSPVGLYMVAVDVAGAKLRDRKRITVPFVEG